MNARYNYMHKFYINLTLELNPKHYNFLIYLLFIVYNLLMYI